MKDERPDELLEECFRTGHRLVLRFSWTDGTEGEAAKRCSRGGSAHWQRPKLLPGNEDSAVAYGASRARKRNPVVPAVANNLVLIEFDGDLVELCAQYDLWALPGTATVRSRRGLHLYYRPPGGRKPMKVQLDATGVIVSEDGYTVGAGALHPSRHVYTYESTGPIVELAASTYDRLVELGRQGQADTRERVANGEPVGEGQRHEALKLHVLQLVRDGAEPGRLLVEALAFNRDRCRPPLDEKEVSRQVRGLGRWAAQHPTEEERANEAARRHLEEHRTGMRSEPRPAAGKRKRALQRRPIRAVEAEPVEYLIEPHVPVGVQTLVAGVGGLGKSALLLAWAARVTQAGGSVLLISYEDTAAQVVRPRFQALGGDLDRLHELYVDALAGQISFPGDLPELERHVQETSPRLLLIDPVSPSIDLKLDAHKDQDARVVLAGLARLAERERIAIVENAHLNKAPSSDPYLRINGSTAFYNAARSVLTVTRDPADPDWQRLVAHHKLNLGKLGDVERWRVVPTTVPSACGPIETMVLEFVEIADDVSREDVLATRSAEQDKLDKAVTFLENALADGDWHDSLGLKALAGARRVSGRTLQRAAQELEVDSERRGFPATTWWRLPQSRQALSPDLGATGDPA